MLQLQMHLRPQYISLTIVSLKDIIELKNLVIVKFIIVIEETLSRDWVSSRLLDLLFQLL
jgi:hypothetical protein